MDASRFRSRLRTAVWAAPPFRRWPARRRWGGRHLWRSLAGRGELPGFHGALYQEPRCHEGTCPRFRERTAGQQGGAGAGLVPEDGEDMGFAWDSTFQA